MSFVLPNLPFAHDALEPYIDTQTMEIHHGKHHATYVNNLNAALANYPDLQGKTLPDLLGMLKSVPIEVKNALRNNGGGHWNHSFFWDILRPKGPAKPVGKLAEEIEKRFGTFERMKEDFTAAALGRFGSGWAWLVVREGELMITSMPNQDNPLMDEGEFRGKPVLGLDVWEHAYYLKYQNRRPEYVQAFWSIVNWEKCEEYFLAALNR